MTEGGALQWPTTKLREPLLPQILIQWRLAKHVYVYAFGTETMATVVLGAQWGDEGKGKIVDVLSDGVQLCCRAQGGHNAGHTIVKGGTTFDVHILRK